MEFEFEFEFEFGDRDGDHLLLRTRATSTCACVAPVRQEFFWKGEEMKHINNFPYVHPQFVVWRWKQQGLSSDPHLLYIADVVISYSDCREIGWTT